MTNQKLRTRIVGFATIIIAFALLGKLAIGLDTYINETFAASTASGSYITGVGNTGTTATPQPACLTAATSAGGGTLPNPCEITLNPNNGGVTGTLPDASGSGTLRLTDNTNNQSSFLILSNPVPTVGGIQATFDIFAYGNEGAGNGADGIGFLILDGTVAPPTVAGAAGGSFGYAQKSGTGATDAPGIAGGYVGIAFDEFGNFSNPTEGRVGGTGKLPEAVGIRGSQATQYGFIKSVAVAPNSIDSDTVTLRPATPINVRVTLSPAGMLEVDMDFTGQHNYTTVIAPFAVATSIANQGAIPSTLRFGFSASTGGDVNFHEIRNFVAMATVKPTLTVSKTHTGNFSANTTGTYTLTVGNAAAAGPTDQTVTVTDMLPVGETYASATGTGWTCGVSVPTVPAGNTQQLVTCTSATSIAPNTNGNPIALVVNVLPNAPASIANTVTANTTDNAVTGGVSATDTATVTQIALLQIYKRILSITSPGTTPVTTTYTPDPGNPGGVLGTATNEPVVPGSTIQYGIYYTNAGALNAFASASNHTNGPTFSDALSTALTYVAGSQTAMCCANPTSTMAAPAFTTTGTAPNITLNWALAVPLVPSTAATPAAQGSITFKAKVN